MKSFASFSVALFITSFMRFSLSYEVEDWIFQLNFSILNFNWVSSSIWRLFADWLLLIEIRESSDHIYRVRLQMSSVEDFSKWSSRFTRLSMFNFMCFLKKWNMRINKENYFSICFFETLEILLCSRIFFSSRLWCLSFLFFSNQKSAALLLLTREQNKTAFCKIKLKTVKHVKWM